MSPNESDRPAADTASESHGSASSRERSSSTPKNAALVTGASRGIGLELARVLAEHGHDLVLVARTEDDLLELASELQDEHGVDARVVPADLSSSQGCDAVVEACQAAGVHVDILVNNAGFGSNGPFAETELATQLDMIQVNVSALTHLTRRFLPAMLERDRGRILQVASTAAFQPGPLMAVYYATKAYVLSFSEAVDEELAGTGVTVTCLCPGPTETPFFEAADMEDVVLVRRGVIMSARKVAEIGYRAMMKGERLEICGLANTLLASSVRFSPRKVVTKIAKKLNSTG